MNFGLRIKWTVCCNVIKHGCNRYYVCAKKIGGPIKNIRDGINEIYCGFTSKKENREKTLTPTSKPSTSPYTYSTEEKEDDGERSRKEEDPRVNGNIFGLIFTNQSRWVVEQMGILIETRVL